MLALDHKIVIFTDGASKGNPGPGGWGAVIIGPREQVKELGGGELATTNNRMELQGAIAALKWLRLCPESIVLYTDSSYLIQGMRHWVANWRQKAWLTSEGKAVANQDLWQELWGLSRDRQVAWEYVPGHQGIAGNERADAIASSYASQTACSLYEGPLSGYFCDPRQFLPLQGVRASSKKKTKPFCYLSLVGGVLRRHTSWPECQAQVSGQSGAKFKKISNPHEEELVKREWGLR